MGTTYNVQQAGDVIAYLAGDPHERRLSTSDSDKCDLLAQTMATAPPGSTIRPGRLRFDFGPRRLPMRAGVTLSGFGRDVTRLVSTALWVPDLGGCFDAAPGAIVEHLTLECAADVAQQAVLTGYAGSVDQASPGDTMTWRDADLIGTSQVAYTWGNVPALHLELERVRVFGGKQLITAGRSSGPDAQFVRAIDTYFDGNAARSRYDVGAIGRRVAAVALYGGRVQLIRCWGNLTGDATPDPLVKAKTPRIPIVRGVWCYAAPGEKGGVCELIDTHFRCQGLDAVDLDAGPGQIRFAGGSGSGTGTDGFAYGTFSCLGDVDGLGAPKRYLDRQPQPSSS